MSLGRHRYFLSTLLGYSTHVQHVIRVAAHGNNGAFVGRSLPIEFAHLSLACRHSRFGTTLRRTSAFVRLKPICWWHFGPIRFLVFSFFWRLQQNVQTQHRGRHSLHKRQNKLGGWVVDRFFRSDISGLRRPKNVKFGTNVASTTGMMLELRFWEKVF